MSFTSEVKDELARVMPACPQCEKATLAALVRIEGTLFVSDLPATGWRSPRTRRPQHGSSCGFCTASIR